MALRRFQAVALNRMPTLVQQTRLQSSLLPLVLSSRWYSTSHVLFAGRKTPRQTSRKPRLNTSKVEAHREMREAKRAKLRAKRDLREEREAAKKAAVASEAGAEAAAAAAAAEEEKRPKRERPVHPGAAIEDFSKPYLSSPATITMEQWAAEKELVKKQYTQLDLFYDKLKAGNHFSDVWFNEYANTPQPLKRGLRLLIALHTRYTARQLQYNTLSTGADGKEQVSNIVLSLPAVRAMRENTQSWPTTHTIKLTPEDKPTASDIRVINGDALDCAFDLKRVGFNPLVLDPVSRMGTPSLWLKGGGAGMGAADGTNSTGEDHQRRSTLFLQSYKGNEKRVEQSEAGANYVPHAIVFRSNAAGGYRMLNEPFTVSFAQIPQYWKPALNELKEDGSFQFRPSEIYGLKRKFRSFLRLAKHYGHDSVVIPAFGSGRFKNPARHVASIWRAVFEEEEFANQLPTVRFAITDDFDIRQNWQPDGSLRPYLEVFGPPGTTGYVPPAKFVLPK